VSTSDSGLDVELNPDGFPQDCFGPSPTEKEDLGTKPDCHYDYSIKCGLALKQTWPESIQGISPFPFQLQDEPDEWMLRYNQFYTYLHYASDLQLRRVLETLDDLGLAEDTIVIFFADHGENGGAHGGMIQKWHTGYDETTHVPCVVSSPRINPDAEVLREVSAVTSHIDIAPTLLGLAGFGADEVATIRAAIAGHALVVELVGADLSPLIRGESAEVVGPDGETREGALFVTDDEISEPLDEASAPDSYAVFLADIEDVKAQGLPIASGPIKQPNHVQCLRVPGWKYVRYWDPAGVEADQWELYDLDYDPSETVNLVRWEDGKSVVRSEAIPSEWGLTEADVEDQRAHLDAELAKQTASMLKTRS
jgi:arylsulfatase A-like enzyme